MVVHTRARELLAWLLPHLATWPREQRHTVSRHAAELVMQLHDALVAARHLPPAPRALALRDADILLDQLRQYLQLAWQWHWLSNGQFEHVSRLTAELGRLIGGWRRRARGLTRSRQPATNRVGRAGMQASKTRPVWLCAPAGARTGPTRAIPGPIGSARQP